MRGLLLAALCALLWGSAASEEGRKSGYLFMSPQTQAMQDDEATGPAALWLLEGEALFDRGCARCHTAAGMKGVAARYPALHKGALLNLEQRINACRVEQQKAPALAYESRELLALASFIGRQSRGLPIAVAPVEPHLEAGRATFHRRQGQLNLSCAQCHDQRWGRKLAGSTIPQGHPTGYPLYRLEWQAVGSLQRRLRNCLTGMRAESYPFGARELVELELYLMMRASGMPLETPAVRP
ncbi:MAG TPA: sulfur oxidation c-type cytochrome SoxA [Burkholderiales bacterium]|nr:sulfur oxidation c-type cytochrome SoxA [Burkholderiales bacterium]